jgi:exodeoxyribonuclease V alpha subunit
LYEAGETVQMIVMTNKSALDANMILQNVYNPSNGEEIERSNRAPWRLTDSVINLENYYENGQIMVCNGALGKILKLDTKKKKVSVKFENCSRTYNAGTNELGHSYCLTVHKYQGSEISCIVFCMDYVPNMSTKEMIYTAITRARHQCHIFAPQNIWKTGCQKNEGIRETRLAERLMEHNGKKSRYF